MARYRVGIDIGGTFTDFVLMDSLKGSIRLHKRLSSPEDPAAAALLGLDEIMQAAGLALSDVSDIVHGTTLVTNAIIERRGACTGLVTTAGFRDVLEFGTEQRYDIYDLHMRFPEPLVPRRLRLDVAERLSRDGDVLVPLDTAQVLDAARRLVEAGAESIAVCFLHAYRNPAHEQRAAALIRDAFPQVKLSLSSEVVREMREYQRFTTTCANAYVQPMMDAYVDRLDRELAARGFRGALRLMHSAGGLISAELARRFPIRLLESGPAGGSLATAWFAGLAEKRDVMAFDMGGTTAKACLVEGGAAEIAPMMEAARVHRFKKGSGLPILAPVIDMIEIGAGGGSIAFVDEVGLLQVGPHSSGADPGPACYGLGGTSPTVTDANLVLGYYDPGFFLGGQMRLDPAAAETALSTIAPALGLSTVETAWGIHKVVSERMAAAARVHIVEKGRDPRRFALVAFGGAGPAHAASVARILGAGEIIVPPASGAASALGFLAAAQSYECVASRPMVLDDTADFAALDELFAQLDGEARGALHGAGVAPDDVSIRRMADMRLVGQTHQVVVDLPDGTFDRASLRRIREAFVAAYAARYKMLQADAAIEAVSFRVRCTGPAPVLSIRQEGMDGGRRGVARKGARRAYFDGGFVEAPVYDRYLLRDGDRLVGPAIIEEREATTVVPPGDTVSVDAVGNLRITVTASAPPQALIPRGMPGEEAIARLDADPISLEIMWSRLITVTEEMWLTVCRTAFSLTICESQDFACDLLDANGETLAHSPRAMPSFNLALPRAAKALLARFPLATLQPGDVLVTNDPWLCVGHKFDIAIVTPVFRDGTVVALAASVGHVTDIGATRSPLTANDAYEEGLHIPPMKLFSAGQPNAVLWELLRENVRNADQVIGDLYSLIAANALGAERLLAFMDEYGLEDLAALAATLQARSEKAMREAIRGLGPRIVETEIFNDPLGVPLRYPLRIEVGDDTIRLDFAGAPPQAPVGGINSVLNFTSAYATFPLKCVLTSAVRGNAGCMRPFTVDAPEHSMVNCTRPAPTSVRQRTGWFVCSNVLNGLAQIAPERARAFSGLPCFMDWFVRDAAGRSDGDIFFVGGGQGASATVDGKSGLIWPTSASNTSVELFESRIPILVHEKTYRPDSGGAGRQRGGLGAQVRIGRLRNDDSDVSVFVIPAGVIAQDGLLGGKAGATANAHRIDLRSGEASDLGAGRKVTLATVDEVLEVRFGGGSGFGPPAERPLALVERDLADGYVTPAGVARDYGIILESAAVVNQAQAAE